MAKHVLLNNISHKNLKIITKFSAEYGDSIASTLTFPTEFDAIQKEYPILFRKDPETEKFQSIALFGFQTNENLFLDTNHNSGWSANYIPAIVVRGPFLIGFQNQSMDGGNEKEPIIHIDTDSPRLSETEGQPVFLEHGGNSPYLDYVSTALKIINEGSEINDIMFTAFTELDLIEPINIDIELNNGDKYQLSGNYTISEEKLAGLSGEQLERLNRSGFLQSAFQVISSLNNVQKLINIKNSKVN